MSFAPATAHRPIGPSANTTTESPIRTLPDSAALKPVEAMSASRTTCSSVTSSGIGVRFACADGTSRYSAWAPLMVLPKRQPPSASIASAVAALAEVAGQARAALAARRDRADEDALADLVPGDAGAELLDDADRLMADDEPRADRVLALHDVDVGAADRRRGHADDGLAWTGMRPRDLLDADVARAVEHRRPHEVGRDGSRSRGVSATSVMAGLQIRWRMPSPAWARLVSRALAWSTLGVPDARHRAIGHVEYPATSWDGSRTLGDPKSTWTDRSRRSDPSTWPGAVSVWVGHSARSGRALDRRFMPEGT